MPSELQRVAQALVEILDEMPRVAGYLQGTARRCRDNAAFVGTSNHPSAQRAAIQLDEAARRCDEAAHYLSQASSRAMVWAQQMVSGTRQAGPGHSSTEPGGARRSGTRPAQLSDENAREMFRRLPVRVERKGHREKTRGLWRGRDGTESGLVSGVDPYRAQADELAKAKKIGDVPHALAITSHVEVKFAMFMRERGLLHETIVINNEVCEGDASCRELLGRFLPPGGTLTVFGPTEDGFRAQLFTSDEPSENG